MARKVYNTCQRLKSLSQKISLRFHIFLNQSSHSGMQNWRYHVRSCNKYTVLTLFLVLGVADKAVKKKFLYFILLYFQTPSIFSLPIFFYFHRSSAIYFTTFLCSAPHFIQNMNIQKYMMKSILKIKSF